MPRHKRAKASAAVDHGSLALLVDVPNPSTLPCSRRLGSAPIENNLSSLPVELHALICQYLPPRSLVLLSLSCPYFYHLLQQDRYLQLWSDARRLHWTELEALYKTPGKLTLPPPPVHHVLPDGTQWLMDERRWAMCLFSGGHCYVCRTRTYMLPASIALHIFVCSSIMCQATFMDHTETIYCKRSGMKLNTPPEPTPSPYLPERFPLCEDISSFPILETYLQRHPEVRAMLRRRSPARQFVALFMHLWKSDNKLIARHVEGLMSMYNDRFDSIKERGREMLKLLPTINAAAVADPFSREDAFSPFLFEDAKGLAKMALMVSETSYLRPGTIDIPMDDTGLLYNAAEVKRELERWWSAQEDPMKLEEIKVAWRRMAGKRASLLKSINAVIKWKNEAVIMLQAWEEAEKTQVLDYPAAPELKWTVPRICLPHTVIRPGWKLTCAHCDLIRQSGGTASRNAFVFESKLRRHMKEHHGLKAADIDVMGL